MTRKVPTHSDIYSLFHDEAEELAAALTAKGYRAKAEATGMCSTIDGKHVHLEAVVVQLTPAQARRLAGTATARAELSEPQQQALELAGQEGGLERRPGGYWVPPSRTEPLREETAHRGADWGEHTATNTVRALVNRGRLRWTDKAQTAVEVAR